MEPYYSDESVTLYLGDCRDVMLRLDERADLIVADPPYGETSIAWDTWPTGWLDAAVSISDSLWCFGSFRMFLTHADEFWLAGWKLSQDVIWSKPRGGVAYRDRATVRTHEQITHWYRGDWSNIHHEQQRSEHHGPGKGTIHRGETGPAWNGARRAHAWTDPGTRALPSVQEHAPALTPDVIRCQTMRMRGIHDTEKPSGILEPLIAYGCPPGGLAFDPTAGSCSTLAVARSLGRRAIGVEGDEAIAEKAALRLSQATIDFAGDGA